MSELARDLRAALARAGFTHDAVADLLGEPAHAALGRNETTPGERATRGGSPLETLTRLFLLQRAVSRAEAEAALPGLVDRMAAEGLLATTVGEVAARLDVRPYATDDSDLWVVSDLTPGLDASAHTVTPDHVLGISSASTSLAQQTIRRPVDSALDLGTGCGVQALHLAGHARRVVATDVNPRALWVTRFNAALNGVEGQVDVRDGSLLEPVAGERFDLIATNPPFVISPGTGEPFGGAQGPRLVYRDSGLPRDSVVEEIVRGLPGHLNPGGWGRCWPTGSSSATVRGTSGWPPGWTGPATRSWSSARCWTRRRTSSCGCATPGSRPTTSRGTTPGCPGWRSRASRGSGSAGSTCVAPTPVPRTSGMT